MGDVLGKIEYHEGPIECGNWDVEIAFFANHFDCFLFQLPYRLNAIKFELWIVALVLIVIGISLFSNIKENYRWFILNQSIFDFIYCYDFVCLPTIRNDNKASWNKCYSETVESYFHFSDIMRFLPSMGLFLITGSRFAAIYYPSHFKKWNTFWKIFLTIIFFDIAYISSIGLYYYYYLLPNDHELFGGCVTLTFEEYSKNPKVFEFEDVKCSKNATDPLLCYYMAQIKEKPCLLTFAYYFEFGHFFINFDEKLSHLLLFSSSIFVVCLITKLIRQFKFQASTNREMLKINIRLVIVFSIQTSIMTFLSFIHYTFSVFGIEIETIPIGWLTDANTIRAIQQIRIFIDSIVVLTIMSGYRENMIRFCLWIFEILKNRKMTFLKLFSQ